MDTTRIATDRTDLDHQARLALRTEMCSDSSLLEWPLELRQYSSELGVKHLIDSILASSSWVDHIAANSFRHVLGFDKFVLASVRPLGQLRLHVWWPGETRLREDIHNHRFDFMSLVISGTMRARIFREDSNGRVLTVCYTESAEPSDHQWSFEERGPIQLTQVLIAALPTGTSYRLSADALHCVEAGDELVVTLLLEMESRHRSSNVYTVAAENLPQSSSQVRFSPMVVREKFNELQTLLS